MKAAVFQGKGLVECQHRPDPGIEDPGDAIVRVGLTCVCGSDLWFCRGLTDYPPGSPIGHEFIGVVEQVGDDVSAVAPGDFVISPWSYSDGTCPNCRAGITTACCNGGFIPLANHSGGQGELVRLPLADGTLVKVPGSVSDYSANVLASFLTLSDVMGTGYHAAVCARVRRSDTVAVVGDGAVGLCAVIAAKLLGAERIIVLSRHPARQRLAEEFGATHVVAERDGRGGAGDHRRRRCECRAGMCRNRSGDADGDRHLPGGSDGRHRRAAARSGDTGR